MAYKKKNMKGKGFLDTLKNVHSKIKEGKYISKGLKYLGSAGSTIPFLGQYSTPLTQAGNLASTLGYGRKKKMNK